MFTRLTTPTMRLLPWPQLSSHAPYGMYRAMHTATFGNVTKSLPDPMQDLKKLTDADSSLNKIDLGAGVYRDEHGSYHEFDVVREAKKRLDVMQIGHDYNPTTGISSFTKRAANLLFGSQRPAIRENRLASVQTVGGTGANRIGAAFLRRNLYDDSNIIPCAHLGEPAWGNYHPLFENAGIEVKSFVHSKRGAKEPDFQSILSAARTASSGSIFVLQASCHNPTGLDYSQDEWEALATEFLRRGHFAFFDAAYLGFGSGNLAAADLDAWALRHFADRGVDMLVCQSFSKTFGLYSERVGALHVVCQSSEIADNVFDQLRAQIRWEVSSAPAYGANLVDLVLGDEQLNWQWKQELQTAAARIETNRLRLHELLTTSSTDAGIWDHIQQENGLFSYMTLTKPQIDSLMKQDHIYLPPNGRINVAGLTRRNIERAAQAMSAAIKQY